MKQETNNEIDLLLRRLSRRQDGFMPDGDLHADTDHLDADELSSYAENALPVAARARYTEHLAECSRCREFVVQLSSAAGVVVAEEPTRVSAPSGLRHFLASLFSPMVLRYAVPALGIIVVAVIGFTVFRREGPLGNMATSRAPISDQQPATNSGDVYDSASQSESPGAIADQRGQRKEVQAPPPKPQPSASVAADAATVAAPVTKTDSAAAANAAPPPAAKARETADEIRKQEPEVLKAEEAQKKAEEVKAAATPEQQKEKVFTSQARAEDKQRLRTASREAKRGVASGAAPAAATESIASLRDVEKDRDDVETRSVGGRRFRKQGGVWVDTAYTGGATTDFARGSEGYRTLVADEPTIKTIADQLDGQIIVVWKGRAYRIR